MLRLLYIGLGGSLGALCRYGVGEAMKALLPDARLPYGTLVANLAGCFLIGLLGATVKAPELLTADLRAMIFTGFLGAFTTFSTFSSETLTLFQDGKSGLALVNLGVQLACGLLAVWIGLKLGAAIVPPPPA